jgi:hypothetical protein
MLRLYVVYVINLLYVLHLHVLYLAMLSVTQLYSVEWFDDNE